MLDPVRAKAKVIAVTAASFVGGVLLASGMEWTTGIQASTLFQAGPPAQDVRPIAELSEAFISIAESVTPAVVSISTQRSARVTRGEDESLDALRRFFQLPPGGGQAPQRAGGTGFIISDDGYIITNNHVVEGADRITVVLLDRREYVAELIGRDPTTDVAVIRIEGRGLPTVRLGNPDAVRVGEWVLAIGNPLGLDFTVTAGIVSAKGRGIGIIGETLRSNERNNEIAVYAVESFIQTDAAINPGNSGGPLVNIRGEVVGVNSAIASNTGLSQGYGFAIPIDLARRVADDLIRYGRSRRAVLGVQIDPVTVEDAEVFGLASVGGALVQGFSMPNSPAERAGLRPYDVIVGVNGQPVTQVNELQRIIANHRPGDRVTLDVIRYGQEQRFQVQLVEAEGAAASAPVPSSRSRAVEGRLGVRVAPLTPERAEAIGHGSSGGVVIDGLQQFGPLFERAPWAEGARIVRVDGQEIADVAQFERLLREKPAGSVVSLVLQIPNGTQRIVNVRLPN
jgi:serine protease Do